MSTLDTRADFPIFKDHEQVEDVLSALQLKPRITYRDLLTIIASSFASRIEYANFYSNDSAQLRHNGDTIEFRYDPPDNLRNAHFHEGYFICKDGTTFVLRQSPIDPESRVRAYTYDGERDAHDWVSIPRTRRREIVDSLLIFSQANPPQPA